MLAITAAQVRAAALSRVNDANLRKWNARGLGGARRRRQHRWFLRPVYR